MGEQSCTRWSYWGTGSALERTMAIITMVVSTDYATDTQFKILFSLLWTWRCVRSEIRMIVPVWLIYVKPKSQPNSNMAYSLPFCLLFSSFSLYATTLRNSWIILPRVSATEQALKIKISPLESNLMELTAIFFSEQASVWGGGTGKTSVPWKREQLAWGSWVNAWACSPITLLHDCNWTFFSWPPGPK